MVVPQTGHLSYTIKLPDGCIVRRHLDRLRSRPTVDEVEQSPTTPVPDPSHEDHGSGDPKILDDSEEPKEEYKAGSEPQHISQDNSESNGDNKDTEATSTG